MGDFAKAVASIHEGKSTPVAAASRMLSESDADAALAKAMQAIKAPLKTELQTLGIKKNFPEIYLYADTTDARDVAFAILLIPFGPSHRTILLDAGDKSRKDVQRALLTAFPQTTRAFEQATGGKKDDVEVTFQDLKVTIVLELPLSDDWIKLATTNGSAKTFRIT